MENDKAPKTIIGVATKANRQTPTGIEFGCTKDGTILINELNENGPFGNQGLKVGMKVLRVNEKEAKPHEPSELACLVNHQLQGRIVIEAESYNESRFAKPPKVPDTSTRDVQMEQFCASALDETRAILEKKRNRGFGFFAKRRFKPQAPEWVWRCKEENGLQLIYKHHRMIRDFGQVVWGCIVQANNELFDRRQHDDCPAVAIYSLDPYFDGRLSELREIASCIFELKGENYEDNELRLFSRVLSNERTTLMKQPVPKYLTGGRDVFYSTIMVHRKQLPVPFLDEVFFPLLVAPEYTTATMILPKEYWGNRTLWMWGAS